MSNIERTDTNVGNIKKDIERCEQLIKPERANWIGISNQLAIAGALARIKELEEKNRVLCEEYCPRIAKIKDLIENETINIGGFECIAVEDLEELLEESK